MTTGPETLRRPPSATPRVLRHRVSEIYGPVIQGEGALVGVPTIFVRFGGCDFRCSWCDSLHAVLPEHRGEWTPMTPEEILARCMELSSPMSAAKTVLPLITLSGGNPALQPLQELIDLGHKQGFWFALETQGSVAPEWLSALDFLVLSPKPPSSHMTFDEQPFLLCNRVASSGMVRQSVKVVVMDETDLNFLGDVRVAIEDWNVPLYAQVGNPYPPQVAGPPADLTALLLDRYRWLSDAVMGRGWYDVRVLPQVHTLAYHNQRAT